jgi:hypothetical protein
MPILKRVLLFAAGFSILAAGSWAALALSLFFDAQGSWLSLIVFFGTLALSVLAFVLFCRNSRKWKITLAAVTFLRDRELRRRYPLRAKIARRVRRGLLWLPLCASAFTLFFPPATSQVIFSSHHLAPYIPRFFFRVLRNAKPD